MKKIIFWLITVLSLATGILIGYALHTEVLTRAYGVNHITIGDVVGCYFIGFAFGVGLWTALLWKFSEW